MNTFTDVLQALRAVVANYEAQVQRARDFERLWEARYYAAQQETWAVRRELAAVRQLVPIDAINYAGWMGL